MFSLSASIVGYNTTYRPVMTLADGRILATRYDGTAGLYVVDGTMTLRATLNTTTPATVNNGLILASGKILLWATYVAGASFYRSTDLTFTTFTTVHTMRANVLALDRNVDYNAATDTIMYAEYSFNGDNVSGGVRTDPSTQRVYKGTADASVWDYIWEVNRNPQYGGDTEFVRHLHTVRYDRFGDIWWVGSGDGITTLPDIIEDDRYGYECNIWTLTPAGVATKILTGSQMYRTTGFLFDENHIIWGTDTNKGGGSFYRMPRATLIPVRTTPVQDSIRIQDRFRDTGGRRYYIANQSYEFGPDDDGHMRLLGSFDGKRWQELHKWVKTGTVSGQFGIFYNLIDAGNGRVVGSAVNYKKEDGTAMGVSTIMLDVTSAPVLSLWANGADEFAPLRVLTEGESGTEATMYLDGTPYGLTYTTEGAADDSGVRGNSPGGVLVVAKAVYP